MKKNANVTQISAGPSLHRSAPVEPPRPLLTVAQFAELSGWSPKTVRQLIWKRELPFIKLGRSVRLEAGTLEMLIERGRVPALEQQ